VNKETLSEIKVAYGENDNIVKDEEKIVERDGRTGKEYYKELHGNKDALFTIILGRAIH